MRIIKLAALVLALTAVSACGSKIKTYDGPEVTTVQVHKADRKMYLLHQGKVLRVYDVALGFAPEGHKQIEGDGRTPEGAYVINRRNPNSTYHLSLGISYPNQRDIEVARALGKSAGGDIFIHGTNGKKNGNGRDWTAGCIAVEDGEIEEIYAMVKNGTTVHILP